MLVYFENLAGLDRGPEVNVVERETSVRAVASSLDPRTRYKNPELVVVEADPTIFMDDEEFDYGLRGIYNGIELEREMRRRTLTPGEGGEDHIAIRSLFRFAYGHGLSNLAMNQTGESDAGELNHPLDQITFNRVQTSELDAPHITIAGSEALSILSGIVDYEDPKKVVTANDIMLQRLGSLRANDPKELRKVMRFNFDLREVGIAVNYKVEEFAKLDPQHKLLLSLGLYLTRVVHTRAEDKRPADQELFLLKMLNKGVPEEDKIMRYKLKGLVATAEERGLVSIYKNGLLGITLDGIEELIPLVPNKKRQGVARGKLATVRAELGLDQ